MNPIEVLRDMRNPPFLYVIATGAGAGIQKRIWDVPGVSNFFVGSMIPYDQQETADILGFVPDKFVSEEMAVDLAMAAYMRAWRPGKKAIGLGVTCSVASTRAHRGDHRVIAAAFCEHACYLVSAVIPKGEGQAQRLQDGELADEIALYLLTVAIGGEIKREITLRNGTVYQFPSIDHRMEMAKERIFAHPLFRINGTRGKITDIYAEESVFYPGAFNPPHDGHFAGAAAAMSVADNLSRKLIFATTVNPPHKNALTVPEMLQRAKLMRGNDFLLTEDDPLYIDKAQKFPGAHFIMGADAMDRMLDPIWGVDVTQCLNQFVQLGTRFFVLGRLVGTKFLECEEVLVKNPQLTKFIKLFFPVKFRLDISSTELRNK
jgi:hypothetical protein